MLTLLIVFISICLAGAAFWFFNKRQINSLVENIDDKQAIINALQSHVESVVETTNHSDVVLDLRKDKKKRNNGNNQKKMGTQEKHSNNSGEKKSRPKPRRKPRTQQ